MKLDEFFSAVAPIFHGIQSARDAPAALRGIPRARLELYAHFCAVHRREVLEGIHGLTPRCVTRHRWNTLVADFFRAHPCRSWDLNANAEAFPAFLAARTDVPPWLHELADLEWWHFQSFVHRSGVPRPAANDRLAPTLAVRPYAHDVVSLFHADAPPSRQAPVRATPVVALVWRDARLVDHVTACSPGELVAIKALVEKVPVATAARAAGMTVADVRAAHAQLVDRGVIVAGRRRASAPRRKR